MNSPQPEPLTGAVLDEWQALSDTTTAGEWFVTHGHGESTVVWASDDDAEPLATLGGYLDRTQAVTDATFIATARTALPQLLAEVRRLSDALATWTATASSGTSAPPAEDDFAGHYGHLPVQPVRVADVLANFTTGDQRSWADEAADLDLEDTIASVAAHGVLHPITLGTDGRVLDGHHRLLAAHQLGIEQVPARLAHMPRT